MEKVVKCESGARPECLVKIVGMSLKFCVIGYFSFIGEIFKILKFTGSSL